MKIYFLMVLLLAASYSARAADDNDSAAMAPLSGSLERTETGLEKMDEGAVPLERPKKISNPRFDENRADAAADEAAAHFLAYAQKKSKSETGAEEISEDSEESGFWERNPPIIQVESAEGADVKIHILFHKLPPQEAAVLSTVKLETEEGEFLGQTRFLTKSKRTEAKFLISPEAMNIQTARIIIENSLESPYTAVISLQKPRKSKKTFWPFGHRE